MHVTAIPPFFVLISCRESPNSDSTVRLVWAPALQAVSPSRSDHPLLRIFDAAVEAGLRRLAVEGEREVAERVGRVRGPVVHRLRPQRLQLVVASVDPDWFLISRAHSDVTPLHNFQTK